MSTNTNLVPDLTLSYEQVKSLLPIFHTANRTLHIQGSPGVGKSAAVIDYAANVAKLPLVDIRPARKNPVDFSGLPWIMKENNSTMWTRPDIILEVPAVYVVEEIATAARLTQVVLYELIGDRRIGKYPIAPGSLIVTTGNRPEDAAHVEKISSALRGRYTAVTMRADPQDFLNFAAKNRIHPMVSGFINYKKQRLSEFDGKKWDGVSGYPSPRAWHRVSDLMWSGLADSPLLLNVVAGDVGYAPALEFTGYVETHHKIITPEQIILDPLNCRVADDRMERWATASAISLAMKPENAEPLYQYLQRLDGEYSFFAIRHALGRNPMLLRVPIIRDWALANQGTLQSK